MPLITRELIQVCLLFLCVPVQYYISSQWSFDSKQREHALKSLIYTTQEYIHNFFEWELWKKWLLHLFQKFKPEGSHIHDSAITAAESPAVEVLTYRNRHGYFGASAVVRHKRPDSVEFRVGQVVTHKIWGYTGVIVGWDEFAKAPESWLQSMHPSDKKYWRYMPNYAVMVDVRDRFKPQITYVPQENLKVVVSTKIKHPQLDLFFSGFDGAQYLPWPWLRALYPAD